MKPGKKRLGPGLAAQERFGEVILLVTLAVLLVLVVVHIVR
jgi:hypothetical protein